MSALASTPEEILRKQSNALREAILEAKVAESRRISKLGEAISKERERQLQIRFEKEREHDEDKINNLLNDLNQLKSSAGSGMLQPHQPGHTNGFVLSPTKNRFTGYETSNDVVSNLCSCMHYCLTLNSVYRNFELKLL